jgi:hypothetical protein
MNQLTNNLKANFKFLMIDTIGCWLIWRIDKCIKEAIKDNSVVLALGVRYLSLVYTISLGEKVNEYVITSACIDHDMKFGFIIRLDNTL